jgi:hypothetical protein
MTPNLLDKLNKILALTTSPVEGEAAAATHKLKQLLTEHNLEMADLEKRGFQQAPGVHEQQHDLGKAAFAWKLDLADMIAEHFYCASVTGRYGRYSHNKEVKFVGRPDNVESLTMLYKWLIEQIKAISAQARRDHFVRTNEHIDPLRWQVAFGKGVVDRLEDRLAEIMKRKQDQAAKDSAGALVVHHQAEISDFMEKRYGWRTDGRETAQQREYREEREADEKLKKEDPEAYYAKYPWERPLTPEQQAEKDAKDAAEAKRQARNDRRRERNAEKRGYSGRRSHGSYNYEAESQKSSARKAGREASKDINLEPFLTGGKTTINTGAERLRS